MKTVHILFGAPTCATNERHQRVEVLTQFQHPTALLQPLPATLSLQIPILQTGQFRYADLILTVQTLCNRSGRVPARVLSTRRRRKSLPFKIEDDIDDDVTESIAVKRDIYSAHSSASKKNGLWPLALPASPSGSAQISISSV